jgi:hypothetical protein
MLKNNQVWENKIRIAKIEKSMEGLQALVFNIKPGGLQFSDIIKSTDQDLEAVLDRLQSRGVPRNRVDISKGDTYVLGIKGDTTKLDEKQFNEMQTFNAKLAYANKLFMEGGFSDKEKLKIAEAFDIPEGTVKSRLFVARQVISKMAVAEGIL